MDLKDIDTADLIKELDSRGYTTRLLFCVADVEDQLTAYNEVHHTNKQLGSDDKQNILDDLPLDYVTEVVNDLIWNRVASY